jgi:hypothetical protein
MSMLSTFFLCRAELSANSLQETEPNSRPLHFRTPGLKFEPSEKWELTESRIVLLVKRGAMSISINDLKRAGLLVMLAMLIATAPHWLNPANQHASNYDAPWVYPGLSPGSH